MQLFLLPAFAFALLFNVVQATPVLMFQRTDGDGLSYNCSEPVGDVMVGNVDAAVNAEAIAQGYIAAGSDQYLGVTRRRNLRSDGERQLGFCSNNGCAVRNSLQYCWIIGCSYRRRELDETAGSQVLECPALVAAAQAALDAQVATQNLSVEPTGATCAAAFSSIAVSCEEE